MINTLPPHFCKRVVGEVLHFSLPLNDGYVTYKLVTNAHLGTNEHQFVPKKQWMLCSLQLKRSGFFWWRIEAKKTPKDSWERIKHENEFVEGEVQVDPAWMSQAIVYNVFVRFFKGTTSSSGDPKPGEGGTFDDVKAHLSTLKEMGINTLYLNPIHLIGNIRRKYNLHDFLPAYLQPGSPYSIKDYKSIDPELTYDRDTNKHLLSDPQQEFRDLVQSAHDKGIFVVMDLVFNHTAHDFVFQRIRPEWYLYKNDPLNLDMPYLSASDVSKGLPWGDPQHTVPPFDHGSFFEDAAQLNWEYMIPQVNGFAPKNPSLKEMWDYFISIPQYWVKHFGVDGFRCDVAYRIPQDFWRECIRKTRSLSRELKNNLSHDVIFIAETYTDSLKDLQEAGFSCVYSDYSHKLGRPLELKGYLDYLYNISGDFFPDGSKWFLFPESHDFARTPQKILGNESSDTHKALLANQSRYILTATLPGVPLIFNGFEKVEWQPVNLFAYGAVDWQRDSDLKEFIAKVNAIRHKHIALRKGNYTYLETNQGLNESTQLFAYARTFGDQTIIVIVNMDVHCQAGPAVVYLSDEYAGAYMLTDLLTGKRFARKGQELLVTLDPGEAHLFLVN